MFNNENTLRLYAQIIRDAVVAAADGIVPMFCEARHGGGSQVEDYLIEFLRDCDQEMAANTLVDLVFSASASPDEFGAALMQFIDAPVSHQTGSAAIH